MDSRKRNYDVKGLSVKKILAMDNKTFNQLNEKQLREVLGRLVSAGNKRLRDFEKKGEKSPAYNYIMGKRGKGRFTTKVSGDTARDRLNALRAEFARAKDFFNAETSTVKKWLPIKETIIKGMNKQGVKLTNENFYDIFDVYQELKAWDKSVTERAMKYGMLREIEKMTYDWKSTAKSLAQENGLLTEVTDKQEALDLIAAKLKEDISKVYEEQQKTKFTKENTVSDFF